MRAQFDGNSSLGDLGEEAVLSSIFPLLSASSLALIGPGDDAAVLSSGPQSYLSIDTMTEGRDFSTSWSSARQLGHKAAASNLADIAAMGVPPTALLVALTAPPSTKLNWITDFTSGLTDALLDLAPNAGVVGGDLSLGERIHIAVTSFGTLETGNPVTRSGAQPGNQLAIAGQQGWAAAGLELLASGERLGGSKLINLAISAQLTPNPPIALGDLARRAGATAMLDVSDGLSRDALRLAHASGVTLVFDSESIAGAAAPLIPLAEIASSLAPENRALEWFLHGGEDHSLLATFPIEATLPDGFVRIGSVQDGEPGLMLDSNPLESRGWDALKQS